jgi:hypothetical protein
MAVKQTHHLAKKYGSIPPITSSLDRKKTYQFPKIQMSTNTHFLTYMVSFKLLAS